MQDKERKILIINDGQGTQKEVETILGHDGYKVTECPGCREAIAILQTENFDLVLLDIKVVVAEGVDQWEEIRRIHPELPVVTVSFGGSYRAF